VRRRAFLRYVLPGLGGVDQPALDREPEDAHTEPFLQPTLHLTGRQDDVVGYSDAWNRIGHYPRASFTSPDSAGHNIVFEQAALCSVLVADWLGRIRQGF
jgi:pimeloyl-ACP methyl ester carboxylesterase